MKKKSAVAEAVSGALGYIKVTIVTPSVTNRYTPCTVAPLVGATYTGVSSVDTRSTETVGEVAL